MTFVLVLYQWLNLWEGNAFNLTACLLQLESIFSLFFSVSIWSSISSASFSMSLIVLLKVLDFLRWTMSSSFSARSANFSALSWRTEQCSKRCFRLTFKEEISSLTTRFASCFSLFFFSSCCLFCSRWNSEEAFFTVFLSSWSILTWRMPPQLSECGHRCFLRQQLTFA